MPESAVTSSSKEARRGRDVRSRRINAFALDRQRYFDIKFDGRRSLVTRLRLWLLEPDFRAVACFRFSHAMTSFHSRHKLIGLLPRIVSRLWRQRLLTKYHVGIQQEAHIGPGLFIAHASGIYIGMVSIGANCTLFHNVTLGRLHGGTGEGLPTLGDNVWIGPGATLLGDITIGNNVAISAGTVLSKSVPDRCLVSGNPGRIVQQDYDVSKLMMSPVSLPETEDGAHDA